METEAELNDGVDLPMAPAVIFHEAQLPKQKKRGGTSHNVAFLPPSATSACQPMDVGIIANTKAKTRNKFTWM